jgi:hypothetical protein
MSDRSSSRCSGVQRLIAFLGVAGVGSALTRRPFRGVRRPSRNLPPRHVDPLKAIHERCRAETLRRIARAIEEGRGDSIDADIWRSVRKRRGCSIR